MYSTRVLVEGLTCYIILSVWTTQRTITWCCIIYLEGHLINEGHLKSNKYGMFSRTSSVELATSIVFNYVVSL